MQKLRMKTVWFIGLMLVLSLVAAQCTPSQTGASSPAESEQTGAQADTPAAAEEATVAPEATATEETAVEPEAAATEETMKEESADVTAEGEPLVVGLLTDQSGALAVYGPQQEAGFRLGLEYATDGTMTVAGRPIEVIVKDNGSDPEKAVSDARELIESEGAKILVGTVSSGATLGMMQVAKENDVILIAEPAASPAITADNFDENTFRTSRTSVQDALTMGAALVEQGQTFVQVAPDYAFGYGSAAGFYNVVKANGGEFVINDSEDESGTVFIPQDTTDFTPYLTQVLDSGADVLIVTWAGDGFVPLFQQAQELGIFDSMVVATGMGDNQTLASGYADAVGSVGVSVYHYTLPDNPVNDWLVEHHIEKYGSPPDLFTAGGMAAAIMLVKGVEATGGDTSDTALIKAFEGMEFEGPKGTYKIRPEDHVALQPMYLVKLDNVTDPDFKFFELIKAFGPDDTAPPCAVPAEMGRCKE